ncbi:inter-alpha-trypsin inhibitor heavy chain H4-like isoform X3 [Anticarsia gemmatalis]|uniref:inter-alpha-trypsin inhibitor heavy chain H4-like isoform X3 n=1 Tax=Anticarsia gemmatalis TaxID=129554 RepID=UPI003F777A6D
MARWLALFGGLCLLALAHSAAVPTVDTMVVAKSDDTIATTPTSVADITTEESSPPIKLTEMEVISEVSLRYAHTTVVARVRNPAKRAQEAHFRVLLPETAFISGFVMTLDGKSYKAYVKEKEEAKQIYQDAVSQGIGAAHISAKARDSNHFTVAVNVEASSNAIFNLTYEELLVRRNGVYNHAINLHPGALVPKLTVTVHIKESEKLIELRVPEIRTGNEIDATKDDAQNSRATIVRSHDDREATITFTPDLQEQERLIQLYTEKSKESAAASHSSSSWYSAEPETTTPEGVLGQFVVQYDVARPKDGEVLVNDGYFVHFFAPTNLEALNKLVVFVLDTSGSMMDRKIIQLREAMQTILGELNAGDYFSIVEFNSAVTVHDLKEADGEPPKRHYSYFDYDKNVTLVPPSPATPENIAKAKLIVSWLQASGGTNIGRALDVAVELINKGVDWKASESAVVPAAKENSDSPQAAASSDVTTAASTEVAVEKTEDKKTAKSLEPIIIFLTDGDPTVGETDPKRIITRVQEKNYGENKATIFSLAFGEDADRKFLRKVSLRNGGFMRHIYEAADAALQLRDFYRQISSPLLAHLKFTYPSGQVKSDSLTKHEFRTYYAGSEVVVAGRVEDSATEITPQLAAFCGVRDGYGRKRYEVIPRVPVEKKKSGYLPLERLWSYLTIKQLLDKHDAGEDAPHKDDEKSEHEKKALELALKYSFVTPLTSLVVVKPNATNAVNAESVDKAAGIGPVSGGPLSITSNLLARPMASHNSFGHFGLSGPAPAAAFGAAYISPGFRVSHDSSVNVVNRGYVGGGFAQSAGGLSYRSGISHFISQQYTPYDKFFTTPVRLPAPTTTFAPIVTPKSVLVDYNLLNYPWAEALIIPQNDTLLLSTDKDTVALKLATLSEVPKESSGDAECASAVDGGAGVCVYLTRCDSAKHITAQVYSTTYCAVSQGYAGVCCKREKVDIVH